MKEVHFQVMVIVLLESIKSKYFYKEKENTYCRANDQYLNEIMQSTVNDYINFIKAGINRKIYTHVRRFQPYMSSKKNIKPNS